MKAWLCEGSRIWHKCDVTTRKTNEGSRKVFITEKLRGGWGLSGTEGGRTRVTYFAEKGDFYKDVCNFVKEGYFFVPRYEVWGFENPLTNHEYAAVMPSDS